MLPKDDQEVEELMLEEVEVFKVGVASLGPIFHPIHLSLVPSVGPGEVLG